MYKSVFEIVAKEKRCDHIMERSCQMVGKSCPVSRFDDAV